MTQLPILNYHGIESRLRPYAWKEEEKEYVVRIDQFEAQAELLSVAGFKSLSLAEMGKWLEEFREDKEPVVMLTFDDGHISHYEWAMPALLKWNLKGLFFVSSELIGQGDHMDWRHLQDLLRHGFEIGSHGANHIPLSRLSESALLEEISGSKKKLEDKLGIAVKSFSVPRGFFSKPIASMTAASGYLHVFTSIYDLNLKGEDPLALKRLVVKRQMGLEDFFSTVSGYLGTMRYVERAKEKVRALVSPEFYMALSAAKRAFGGRK